MAMTSTTPCDIVCVVGDGAGLPEEPTLDNFNRVLLSLWPFWHEPQARTVTTAQTIMLCYDFGNYDVGYQAGC